MAETETLRAHMAGQIAASLLGQWFEQCPELLLRGNLHTTSVVRRIVAEFAVASADDVIARLERVDTPPSCP